MDLQALAERREVLLAGIPIGGIDREARGDHDMRAGTQQLQGRLEADLDACAGDERVVPRKIRRLLAFRVVEVSTLVAHRIVVAMHARERLLADVAGALLVESRTRVGVAASRRRQPQRRVGLGAALDPQARLLDREPVRGLGCVPLRAPERLRHLHEVVALRLRHEASQHDQLAPLLLRQPRHVGAVGLDRREHPEAGGELVVGESRIGQGQGVIHGHIVVHSRRKSGSRRAVRKRVRIDPGRPYDQARAAAVEYPGTKIAC